MDHKLPQYDRPPLNEVVIGVQFQPLKQLQAGMFGLYWSKVRERYPVTEDQVPLARTIEAPKLGPKVTGTPEVILQELPQEPRCWFLDKNKHLLIQLQQDRFIRNWRQVQGDEVYPRFATLLEQFKAEWTGFNQFLADEGIEAPTIDQCELTYVNHIDGDAAGEGFVRLRDVFPSMGTPTAGGFLPVPELVYWKHRYPLPEERGRLHVEMNPAFRQSDFKFIFVFTLTARGAPPGARSEDAFAWFDLAHEWVVQAFDELTGPEMHKLWGRQV